MGEDFYIEVFMGTTYEIGQPKTVNQLKSVLEEIIKDLPEGDHKIGEVHVHNGKLTYTLVEGITQ